MKRISILMLFVIVINIFSAFYAVASSDSVLLDFEDEVTTNSLTTLPGKNRFTVSEANAYSGTHSFLVEKNSVARYDTSIDNGTVTVWLYDDINNYKSTAVLKLTEGNGGIVLGLNSKENGQYYVYRTDNGLWHSSGILRTTGWHQLKVYLNDGEAKLYIDDKEIATADGVVGYDGVEIGDYWMNTEQPVYFDDLNITYEKSNEIQGEDTASDYEDSSDGDEYFIKTVTGLGIMPYPYEDFNKTKKVTKGEFLSFVAKLSSVSGSIAKKSKVDFLDVKASDENSGYAYWAYTTGLLLPDENQKLSPGEAVKRDEAAEILVKLLGYGKIAEQKGGFLKQATDLKLLSGVSSGGDMSRGDVARIIFNSLDVDMCGIISFGGEIKYGVIKGSTIITENMGLEMISGVLRSYGYKNCTYGLDAGDNTAIIDNVRVGADGISDADLLVGYNVDCYYDAKGDYDAVLIVKNKKNKDITIPAYSILDGTTKTRIRYESGDSEKSINLPDKAEYILNGRALFDFTRDDLRPYSGSITLIDNNSDGRVDLINARTHRVIVSDGRNAAQGTVLNKIDGKLYEFKKDNYCAYTIIKGKKEIDFDKINDGDLLLVYEDADRCNVRIEICEEKTEGIINSIDTEEITLDGNIYKISRKLIDSSYIRSIDFTEGKKATVYFDTYGVIVYATITPEGLKYGYFCRYFDDIDTMVGRIKFLDESGVFRTISVADRVYINTNRIDSDELTLNMDVTKPQLIKYQLDSEGNIKRLFTPKPRAHGDSEDMLTLAKSYTQNQKARYNAPSRAICPNVAESGTVLGQSPEFVLKDDAVIFRIINDGTGVDEYSSVVGELLTNYVFEGDVYDANEVNEAGCVVVHQKNLTEGTTQIVHNIVFNKFITKIDEDDEPMLVMEGWADGKKVSYEKVVATNTADIKKFDVVRIRKNVKGEVAQIKVVSDAPGKELISSSKYVVKGNVTGKKDDVIKVAYGANGEENSFRIYSGTDIYVVNRSDGSFEKGEVFDIVPGEYNGSFVVMYISNFKIDNIIVIKP